MLSLCVSLFLRLACRRRSPSITVDRASSIWFGPVRGRLRRTGPSLRRADPRRARTKRDRKASTNRVCPQCAPLCARSGSAYVGTTLDCPQPERVSLNFDGLARPRRAGQRRMRGVLHVSAHLRLPFSQLCRRPVFSGYCRIASRLCDSAASRRVTGAKSRPRVSPGRSRFPP